MIAFDEVTGNGVGTVEEVARGTYTLAADGSFDSGTVELESSLDGGTSWVSVQSINQPTRVEMRHAKAHLRTNTSGVVTAASVFIRLGLIEQ